MLTSALLVGPLLAVVLILGSTPAYWQSRSIPALPLLLWLFVLNLIYSVNSIVWSGNASLRIPVWCDITTKLQIGAASGIFSATLCMAKHFEVVASGRIMHFTDVDHRYRRWLETLTCVVVPIVTMLLHIIVQPRRFDIVQDFGCQPAVIATVPTIFIIYIPPFILAAITIVYSSLGLLHFFTKRLTFDTHLIRSSPNDKGLHLRLMAISGAETLWGIPLMTCIVYLHIRKGLLSWHSWSQVHANFGRVQSYRLSELSHIEADIFLAVWWFIPVSGYVVFLASLFSDSSVRRYRKLRGWVNCTIFRKRSKPISMDTFALSESPTKRIILHKLSTVDIRSDIDGDDQSLPCYSPSLREPSSQKFALKPNAPFRNTNRYSANSVTSFRIQFPPRASNPEGPLTSPPSAPPIASKLSTSTTQDPCYPLRPLIIVAEQDHTPVSTNDLSDTET